MNLLIKSCKTCYYGQEAIESPNYCGGGLCEYYINVYDELTDDDISDIIKREKQEYFDAWIEYIKEDY